MVGAHPRRCPVIVVLFLAAFFALMTVTDLLPSGAELRAGVVAPLG
jgi:hypothetical protein